MEVKIFIFYVFFSPILSFSPWGSVPGGERWAVKHPTEEERAARWHWGAFPQDSLTSLAGWISVDYFSLVLTKVKFETVNNSVLNEKSKWWGSFPIISIKILHGRLRFTFKSTNHNNNLVQPSVHYINLSSL